MESTTTVVTQIEEDFEKRRPPFNNIEFPEERLLEEVSHTNKEQKLRLLSAFSTFDYNRDANQLTDNIIELARRERQYLSPFSVPLVENEDELVDVFEDIGFRYPNRDSHAWCKNNEILVEKYNGRWSELLLETGCDAPALVEQLEEDDMNCLKGDKIAPMYARFIDQYVCDMNNIWELDIPVDTHIARLSRDLFAAPDLSKDAIRAEWRGLAIETGINRHIVDGAMWQIGNNWDEWGEDYWNKVTQ